MHVSFQIKGNEYFEHDAGHLTKMADMPIYGKTIFFPGTSGLISTKSCMKHQRPKPIIFCSNDNHGLTMTYLMGRSNFATYVFIWEAQIAGGRLQDHRSSGYTL